MYNNLKPDRKFDKNYLEGQLFLEKCKERYKIKQQLTKPVYEYEITKKSRKAKKRLFLQRKKDDDFTFII